MPTGIGTNPTTFSQLLPRTLSEEGRAVTPGEGEGKEGNGETRKAVGGRGERGLERRGGVRVLGYVSAAIWYVKRQAWHGTQRRQRTTRRTMDNTGAGIQ